MLNEKNEKELEQINAEREAIVEDYEVCNLGACRVAFLLVKAINCTVGLFFGRSRVGKGVVKNF